MKGVFSLEPTSISPDMSISLPKIKSTLVILLYLLIYWCTEIQGLLKEFTNLLSSSSADHTLALKLFFYRPIYNASSPAKKHGKYIKRDSLNVFLPQQPPAPDL